MIGLYDRDFVESPLDAFFNLQLMKISTYYKNKKEIVNLITDLSRAKYYTKIFYFHEDASLSFPPEIYQYTNIELIGRGINGKFIPLSEEIESCAPDTFIYEQAWQQVEPKKKKQLALHKIQTQGTHTYLSYDGKTLNKQNLSFSGTQRRLIIHDAEIKNIPGTAEYISQLRNGSRNFLIFYRNNIIVHDFNCLYEMAGFKCIELHNIIYNGTMNELQFKQLLQRASGHFLGYVNFFYGNFNILDERTEKDLILLTRRALYAKAYCKPHKTICMQISSNQTINIIYAYLSKWSHTSLKHDNEKKHASFFQYLINVKFFNKEENIEAYRNIITKIPQLKVLFKIDPQIIADNGGIMPL